MRKFFTLLIIIASCQKLVAIPIAEQYQKILAETSANAASETTVQISDIRAKADSLKALPASKDNILAAEKIVFELCSSLYKNTSYHKTINYISYCRPLLESIIPDTKQAQSIYIDILNHYGMSYGSLGLSDLSIGAFEKALKIAEKFEFKEKQAVLYNNIGNIFLGKALYEQADSLFLKSVRINESGKDKKRLYINYNNLSVSAAERSNYNKALEYAFLAMHQLDTERDSGKRMLLQRNIAEIYLKNGEPSLALRNLREVIEYQESHNELRHLADSYSTMAHIFDNSADSFAIYLHHAENAAKRSNSITEIPSILLELGKYYSNKHNYETACRYFEEYAAVKDSILNMEIKIHTQGLSNVYTKEALQADRIEKLENEAAMADSRAKWTMIVSICLLALMILAAKKLLIAQRRKYRQTAKRKLKEKLSSIEHLKEKERQNATALKEKEEALAKSENKQTVMALQALRAHEFTESLSSGIKQLLLKINVRDTDTRKALRETLSDIDRMDNDAGLKEFVKSFEEINSNFYDSLSAGYPSLTARELRMCALVRLGLSSKEIAYITFREVRSVEAVRNRLRKKFALEQSENLADFLKQF